MTDGHSDRPPRVLVIEDELKTASTVALYLRHEGMQVTVAHDGQAGSRRPGAEATIC